MCHVRTRIEAVPDDAGRAQPAREVGVGVMATPPCERVTGDPYIVPRGLFEELSNQGWNVIVVYFIQAQSFVGQLLWCVHDMLATASVCMYEHGSVAPNPSRPSAPSIE